MGDCDLRDQIAALLEEPSNAQLAIDLARRVRASQEGGDPRLAQHPVRRALTSAWLSHPLERSLWELVLEPFGVRVHETWAEPVAAFWVESGRGAEAEGISFDTRSGLPLVFQRLSDASIMHLVALPGDEYVLVDRWPMSARSFRSPKRVKPTPAVASDDALRPNRGPASHLTAPAIWKHLTRIGAQLPSYKEWSASARGDGPWTGESPFGVQDLAGSVVEMLSDVRLSNDEDSPGSNAAWVSVALSPDGSSTEYRYTTGRPMERLGFRCVKRLARLRQYAAGADWSL